MQSKLLTYKIGLGIVGGLAFVLLIIVLVQAGGARQDIKTYKAATTIANKLNNYISKNQKIPSSLQTAGIHPADVPDTITFTKHSDSSYTFCVTYKSASSGVGSSEILTRAVSSYYGAPLNTTDFYSPTGENLYIPSIHKKGQSCQTIKPYFYSSNYPSNTSGSNTYYASTYCGVDYGYSWSVIKLVRATPKQGNAAGTITVDSIPQTTENLDANVKVFDTNCKPISLSDLAAGDYIDLYYTQYGSPVIMIVKD